MIRKLANARRNTHMATQLMFLAPKRCKLLVSALILGFTDFRASSNLNQTFNVYIDGKPIKVSFGGWLIFCLNRWMLPTPFSRLAPRLESRSQDSAIMRDSRSLETAECASSK
jgi:hypothetical protein